NDPSLTTAKRKDYCAKTEDNRQPGDVLFLISHRLQQPLRVPTSRPPLFQITNVASDRVPRDRFRHRTISERRLDRFSQIMLNRGRPRLTDFDVLVVDAPSISEMPVAVEYNCFRSNCRACLGNERVLRIANTCAWVFVLPQMFANCFRLFVRINVDQVEVHTQRMQPFE